jgi:multidrug efflux system membrane fusion protein
MNYSLFPDDKTTLWPQWPKRGFRFWLLCFVIILVVIYLIKHHNTKPTQGNKSLPIVVSEVQHKNVPVYITALGNVTATYTVTVKTQINGLLMKVLYKEGQWVKKGDVLAEIDQRPLLAQLTQYQGQLLRDQALLSNALIDLKRYQRLWKQDSISQQTLATQESLVQQYQGSVAVDQGLIESTKVNLIYCHIISPITGRVGLRLVDAGNFVQTSDTTGLVVITSINPITVIFTIPEDDVPKILPQVYRKKNIKIEAFDRQQNKLLGTGKLLTIDNVINTSTGTVRLRAQFSNKNNKLFPNQFVNIKLLAQNLLHAIVVPTAAIQHSNKDDFVYVLNPDFTVSARPIKTGVTNGDDTVILEGLSVNQKVVVDGADKLTNGAQVKVIIPMPAEKKTS